MKNYESDSNCKAKCMQTTQYMITLNTHANKTHKFPTKSPMHHRMCSTLRHSESQFHH